MLKMRAMHYKNKLSLIIIVIGFFAALFSCGEKENENTSLIPNVGVNFYIQPNTIDYLPAGTWKIYDHEGYRGVILYRLDEYIFIAYERCCPWDPDEPNARVDVDPTTLTLIDSTCMSRFQMLDGLPVDGPSNRPLLQYQTEFDGNYLHVFNAF